MPAGNQSLQSYVPTLFTTQSATSYKSNIDSDTAILGNPAGMFYVYPTSPATMLVNVDKGFSYLNSGTGLVLGNGSAPATVALAAPGSNSYYGTIYYDAGAASFGVVYGPSAVSPVPVLPEMIKQIPLAVVLLASTTTQIQATNITDVRWLGFTALGVMATLGANQNYNVAGASRVDIQFTITTTGTMTLSFTNLQMGVPVSIRVFNNSGGTPTLKVTATSPAGTAYTVVGDPGVNLVSPGYGPIGVGSTHNMLLYNPAFVGNYTLAGPIS